MIDESRLDEYRRIVDESEHNEDVDEIALQIEQIRSERHEGQSESVSPKAGARLDSTLDYGRHVEADPHAGLSQEERTELEISPQEIDFKSLSTEQQVRYWSLLSPGEKLSMVRLHLKADRDAIAHRLQIPPKILRYLEEDQFTQLPAPKSVRDFYRAYAQELGIEPEQLIAQYQVLTGQTAYHNGGSLQNTSSLLLQKKVVWLVLSAVVAAIVLIFFATRGSWLVVQQQGPSALSDAQVLPLTSDKVVQGVDRKVDTGVLYESQPIVLPPLESDLP